MCLIFYSFIYFLFVLFFWGGVIEECFNCAKRAGVKLTHQVPRLKEPTMIVSFGAEWWTRAQLHQGQTGRFFQLRVGSGSGIEKLFWVVFFFQKRQDVSFHMAYPGYLRKKLQQRKKRLRLHSFCPWWTISTGNQWEISEVGRLSCCIEFFALFHIACLW